MSGVEVKGITDSLKDYAKEIGKAFIAGSNLDANVKLGDLIRSLTEATNKIIQSISLVVIEHEYQKQSDHIETWLNAIHRAYKRKKELNKDDEIEEARRRLSADPDGQGINFVMTRVHSLLVQRAVGDREGLLRLVALSMEDQLCDPGNRPCNIKWYLTNHFNFFVRQLRLQIMGLAVQIFMAGDNKTDINDYTQQLEARIQAQLSAAYSSLNPFVQKLKQDYVTPMVNITKWWEIGQWNKRLNKNSDGKVELIATSAAPSNIWRFEPPPDVSDRSMLVNQEVVFPLHARFHSNGHEHRAHISLEPWWLKSHFEQTNLHAIYCSVVPQKNSNNFTLYSEWGENRGDYRREGSSIFSDGYYHIDDKWVPANAEPIRWSYYPGHKWPMKEHQP